MKSWFLTHSPDTFMQFVHALMEQDFGETRYEKSPVFPGFLSFPSKGRIRWTCQRYSLWYIPPLVGLPRMGDTEAMWLGRSAIYFVKWENFLKSLVKINTYAKISINDLLTYSNYGNIWYRLRIMQIDKDTLQGRRKQGGQGAAPPNIS
jgi:hypothetical protein